VQSEQHVRDVLLAWFLVTACGHGQPRPATCSAAFSPLPTTIGDVGPTRERVPFGWVTSVQVTGVAAALARTLEQDLQTRTGTELHEVPLADDVRRLWKSGVVADARVELDPSGAVRFVVTPHEAIGHVQVRGGDPRMARRFRLLEGVPYEPSRILRMTSAARLAYVREGRLDASVEPHASIGPGRVDVCIQATPGPMVTISKLAFSGRVAVPEAKLLEVMRSGSNVNHVGGIYDADAFSVDLIMYSSAYWDAGYAEVKIGEPRIERHGNTVAIEVPITEGALFRYGRIQNQPTLQPLKSGQVFSRSQIDLVRGELQKSVTGKVVPRTRIDPDTHTIDIDFEIE
jgi:outer membrane protein assembly factor BamA